jgi:amidase
MRAQMLAATIVLAATPAAAEQTAEQQWLLVTDRFGTLEYSILTIHTAGESVSGDWDGDPVTGDIRNGRLRVTARTKRGEVFRFDATRTANGLNGEADYPDNNFPQKRLSFRFTGRRIADRPAGGPREIRFQPSDYSNTFSADRPPVLTIWPGDTVHTSTIDSGGIDGKGVTRALFGNPQTGPFFVAGARIGDTLAVHILALTPNRDWADSLDSIVSRAVTPALAGEAQLLGKPVRWRLDLKGGTAQPENATGKLAGFRIPLRPMLGGLGLAPGFGTPPMSTGDTARTGGNMDWPQVAAGNTVLLPVQQPGALLYLGDAHAAQGDGETSQYGLETSMNVSFRVEVIRGRTIPLPRIESAEALMTLGQAGSLDEALRSASGGMIQWLRQDYGLSLSEAAQVMGTAVRFSVPNLAGRSVGVEARIDKRLLPARRAD